MKTTIKVLLTIVVLVVAVVVVRTHTAFDDQQLAAAKQTAPLNLDRLSAVHRLSQAITFPTVSYDDPDAIDSQAFQQFHQFIEHNFPAVHAATTKHVFNNYSLVYHLRGQQNALPPVLLMAHMDVVPVDSNTASKWTHPPFAGVVTDHAIYGRGTMDDKSSLIAQLEALELLLNQGFKPQRDLYLAYGHDEEIGGSNGAAKIAEYFAANNIHFEFVLDEGGAITEGMMKGVTRPVALVGIAEKGFANYRLSVTTQGGHSSQPPKHTAVGILAAAIVKLENRALEPSLDFTRQTFDAIGASADWKTRAIMANLWLTAPLVKSVVMSQPKLAASLHTTLAATMISGSDKSNVLPSKAEAVINARIFPGQTVTEIQAQIAAIIDDERIAIDTFTTSEPSQVSTTDSWGYRLIAQSIRNLDDEVLVAPYLVQGGTDSKYFYTVADNVYRFLPFRANAQTLQRLHGIDEQIAIDDYFATIGFYHQIISQL